MLSSGAEIEVKSDSREGTIFKSSRLDICLYFVSIHDFQDLRKIDIPTRMTDLIQISWLKALSFPCPTSIHSSVFFPSLVFLPQHPPEQDQYGYEDAGERWLPVHSVESIVSRLISSRKVSPFVSSLTSIFLYLHSLVQLLSVISLLSSDTPNTDSPANIDAAKEVRNDIAAYRKKVSN